MIQQESPEIKVSVGLILSNCSINELNALMNFIQNETRCNVIFIKKSLAKLYITETQPQSLQQRENQQGEGDGYEIK